MVRLCRHLLAGSLLGALACQTPTPPAQSTTLNPTASPSVAVQSGSSPVAFELRDFRLEGNEDKNSFVQWTGRGNLVTKAPEAQNRILMAFLQYKDRRAPATRPTELSVVVRDGIGLVETFDFGKEGPDFDWSIHGWVPLNPAQLNAASAIPIATAKP